MMKISKLLCKSFALLSLLLIACSNTDDIQQKVTEIDAREILLYFMMRILIIITCM